MAYLNMEKRQRSDSDIIISLPHEPDGNILNVNNILILVTMASWLVRSSPDRAVRARALAEDITLCSWARHFTLAMLFEASDF